MTKCKKDDNSWMHMGMACLATVLLTGIIGTIVLPSLMEPSEKEKLMMKEYVEYAGTNEIGTDSIERCKLFVCLIDKDLYNGIIERSKIDACRTSILLEDIK